MDESIATPPSTINCQLCTQPIHPYIALDGVKWVHNETGNAACIVPCQAISPGNTTRCLLPEDHTGRHVGGIAWLT